MALDPDDIQQINLIVNNAIQAAGLPAKRLRPPESLRYEGNGQYYDPVTERQWMKGPSGTLIPIS